MKNLTLVALLLLSFIPSIYAQEKADSLARLRRDSIRIADSLQRVQKSKDSLQKKAQEAVVRAADSVRKITEARRKQILAGTQFVLLGHPTFAFNKDPVSQNIEIRRQRSDDSLFYFVVGLVLYLALMRLIFYKYISTMFTLFFRATLRQQQLREQLLQAPLPALLMNIYFVLSVASYITLAAHHNGVLVSGSFWTDLLYAFLLVASVYIAKYMFLNIVGWIFGISSLADTYIFIVFLINKMIGIFLLPFIALLAFPTPALTAAVLTMSYVLIAGMLFYRFLISFRPVRSEIKLTRIQFFLYLCAFEIAPLLLITKVLLEYADRSQ